MKQIINGKRYDTQTAEELGSYWNGLGGGDFRNCTEKLYRTKKGKFFLYGVGGAMSRWSESCEGGNCQSSGSGILPLTDEAAYEWAERYLGTDKVEKLFPEKIVDA